MSIDDGLDLFWVDFQSADIDDAAPTTNEVMAFTALFHNIAGIDKSFGIEKCHVVAAKVAKSRTGRSDAKRTINHFHFDIGVGQTDHVRWKALASVIDLESDAG